MENEGKLTLKFQHQASDIINFFVYYHKKTNTIFKNTILTTLIYLFAIFYLISEAMKYNAPIWEIAPFIAVFLALMFLSPVFVKKRIINTLRKNLKIDSHPDLNRSQTLEVTPESIIVSSFSGSVKTKWFAVDSLDKTPDYVYIFLRPSQAHTLPRRYFSSDKQYNEFFCRLEQYHQESIQSNQEKVYSK